MKLLENLKKISIPTKQITAALTSFGKLIKAAAAGFDRLLFWKGSKLVMLIFELQVIAFITIILVILAYVFFVLLWGIPIIAQIELATIIIDLLVKILPVLGVFLTIVPPLFVAIIAKLRQGGKNNNEK